MRVWMRRGAIGLAAALIGGYMAICAYMYLQQDSLIYPGGTSAVEPLPDPSSAGLTGFEAVTLDTSDGQRLKGWWHAPEGGRGIVLYLQGNRQNLAAGWRVE